MGEAPSFEAVEQAGKTPKWKLTFQPDSFRLEPLVAGSAIEVARSERVERTDVLNGLFLRRLLQVKVDKKNRLFKLDPKGFEAYEAWAGPPGLGDLKKALKRRLGWTFTLGVLFILSAIPRGDGESGPVEPFNPVVAGLGGALILMGILSRFAPNRIFFLADGVWIGSAAYFTVTELMEGFNPWLALVLLLQANLILVGIREFMRFGRMTEDLRDEGKQPV